MVVRKARVVGILALALAALLAGCSKEPAASTDDATALQALDDVDVGTTATLGALKGVLVDDAIRPLAGANLTLSPGGKTASTGEDGVFVFEDLEPGTYFVNATLKGYTTIQGSADVAAGEVASLKLQMVRVYVPEPRHETLHYEGFMPVYLSAVGFVLEIVAPGAAGCICTWELEPDQKGLTTFVYEVTGESLTQNPLPVYGTIYWEFVGDPGTQIESAHGNFPVREVIPRDRYANDTATWTVRVTGSQWVHVNTSYDVYLTLWYNSVPPEDWSFVAGDP